MRRLAAQLLAPAPSHARLRLTAAAATPVYRPGITAHVVSARSTTSWCSRPRPLNYHQPLPQKRRISRTAPLSQDPSPPPAPPTTTTITTTTTTTSPDAHPQPPPLDDDGNLDASVFSNLPFRFDTGIALFAKRTPRPFPPPFLSPPSGSFSDPLSTHDRSRDRRRRAYVGGRLIQGFTNGDDAVFASDWFIGANDGVGAWSARARGHAGLWSRLILHFWATALFEDAACHGNNETYRPDPVAYLQRAYEQTIEATGPPNDWQGTTTAAGAQLHYRRVHSPTHNPNEDTTEESMEIEPLLYATNLGDSQVMVIRPSTREMVYKSAEQWHWFDCPRQLGTNSPDTPRGCAVVDKVPLREGDVVLAMSDGVIDNLWGHEIVDRVCDSLERWRGYNGGDEGVAGYMGRVLGGGGGGEHDGHGVEEDERGMMGFVAEELMEAARVIAVDPFAESPFMEHAIEEGLASGGGKLDDISVVAAICRRNS